MTDNNASKIKVKTEEEKKRILNPYTELTIRHWENMTPDEKAALFQRIRVSISSSNNMLKQRFEKAFKESHLVNEFYYKAGESMRNGDAYHTWDYGIYNKNNTLVMVVDLDNKQSKERDESRNLSLLNTNVKSCIIQEIQFAKSFQNMLKMLMMNYDEYITYIFTECRSIPFPYPNYTATELIKSYTKLVRMNPDDKYHENISVNTRLGDHIIQYFHKSIWHARTKGNFTPYEAWYNDELLMKCIENRIIYQTRLNPNKILQGFNIAKIAPKVSIFSAGRAKLIINKYLSEFDTVFDPFSGFSGRMLGTVSLGKKYIGQDINETTVQESNQMIQFLCRNGYNIDAQITRQNIFESSGTYPCLFTCPPYSDKEQWDGTPVNRMTCDDWIDECLKRFKCKRYIFVVDNTIKYKSFIDNDLTNKSHFSRNTEKLIVIDKT